MKSIYINNALQKYKKSRKNATKMKKKSIFTRNEKQQSLWKRMFFSHLKSIFNLFLYTNDFFFYPKIPCKKMTVTS